MTMAERVMHRFYRSSNGDPSKLPWHREEPAKLLVDTVHNLPAGAPRLTLAAVPVCSQCGWPLRECR